MDTGQYTLTIVATAGPSDGASVRGSLWLESATAARDSAVAPSGGHAVSDTARIPLYGATDVDLAGVSASPLGGVADAAPSPHSLDPRRPGVLVWRRVDSARVEATWRLYIATTDNDRRACDHGGACDDRVPTDGPGVALEIHKLDVNGFAGNWRLIAAGPVHGYFCVAPVRYYSPYKSRNLARPPRAH
jgi:hypothetical protein